LHPLEGGEAAAAAITDAAAADSAGIFGRAAVLDLRIVIAAIGTAHTGSLLAVDRETIGERLDLGANRSLDGPVILVAIGLEAIEHFDDQLADELEFSFAEATRGARRSAQANARGDGRLFRIERHGILVAGDVGALKRGFRRLAGE